MCLQCMVGPWIESMMPTSLPNAWEGMLKKGESPFLTFSFKLGREECMKFKYGLKW